MKEKYLELLTKKYLNLGISKELLTLWADNLATGTDENADEAALQAKVDAIEPILKGTQAFGDKRATDAQKAAEKKFKGEKDDPDPNEPPTDAPAWFKQFQEAQAKKEQELKDQIAALQGKQAQVTFDEMVARVAKEYKLEGDMLDFAKAKLSSDMDETAVKASLGASKESFIKLGAMQVDDGAHVATSDAAAQQKAKEWVDAKIESLKQLV